MLRNPACLAYLVGAIICAVVAGLTWRHRALNPIVAVALTVAMVGDCWWSLGNAVVVAFDDETQRAIATLADYPAASFAIAAVLCFSIAVARPQWVPRRGFVIALLIEPVVITIAAATNPWHQLVYGGAGAARLTGSAGWTHGPIYQVDLWYCYLELGLSLGFIAWTWRTASPAFRRQRLMVFLAIAVPMVANVVFLAGGFGDIVDPTPFSFAATGALIWHAVFRQHLFTFAPVARALILEQIGDAVVVISPTGRILDLNPAATALLRSLNPEAPTELVGALARELIGTVTITDGQQTEIVVDLAGNRAEFEARSSRLLDRQGGELGSVLVARDVTEANEQSRRLAAAHAQLVQQVETIGQLRTDLAEQASQDPLTGLHNRRHLVERFSSMLEVAERTGSPLAVVLFDVDKFKAINDEHGHLAGDLVLVALAQQLREQAPPDALVARWGGEEFFIALPGVDAATGFAFAEDVRRRCAAALIDVGGVIVACTLSGGVAAYPRSGTTMNDLFHSADLSLYAAKNGGRNCVRLDADRVPEQATSARRH